jgi:hypothetical protein
VTPLGEFVVEQLTLTQNLGGHRYEDLRQVRNVDKMADVKGK